MTYLSSGVVDDGLVRVQIDYSDTSLNKTHLHLCLQAGANHRIFLSPYRI